MATFYTIGVACPLSHSQFQKGEHTESLNQEIYRRVRIFRSGQIKALFKESQLVDSKKQHQTLAMNLQDSELSIDCRQLGQFQVSHSLPNEEYPMIILVHWISYLHPKSLELKDQKPC